MPVYNVENHLKRCLDSILCQTYEKLQIILIDDGSTDGSTKICKEYEQQDSRVETIHKNNEGVSVARNVGIETAHGEYICFVDSDDWLAKDYIEKMYEKVQKTFADVVICSWYTSIFQGGKMIRQMKYEQALGTRDIKTGQN